MAFAYYVLYTSNKVRPADIYAYRGMINEQIAKDWTAWHNHRLDSDTTIKQYPKIQYKILESRFAIVGLDSEKKHLFELAAQLPIWGTVNRQPKRIQFARLQQYYLDWQLLPKPQWYQCANFLPMKSDQFNEYKALCLKLNLPYDAPTIQDPALLDFFENLLQKRIREQAESLGISFPVEYIRIKIHPHPIQHRLTKYYKNTVFSKLSNLYFTMNLQWPLHLGVGYGTALGYGTLQSVNAKTVVHLIDNRLEDIKK